MENILAVTACLKRCSIAIMYENVLYEINENVDAAENLVFLANKLIKSNNIKRIDKLITSSGPGSFTGIRTAQSFAKAFSFAKRIPAFSIDYFTVIDKISRNANKKTIVIKSDKDQAYFCKLRFNTRESTGNAYYEDIIKMVDKDELIVGDAVKEISEHLNEKNYEYVENFRQAKFLLKFSSIETQSSQINPLYINTNSNCTFNFKINPL